jgi:TRAP-type C4-dicarboxylate transport system permease small subunit
MRLLRLCEITAAVAIGIATLIVGAVAVSRYGFGFTPVWTEPTVALLIFLAVCLAMPPGLHEGVHVSMHLLDGLAPGLERWRRILGWALSAVLGLALLLSALVYAEDMLMLGLRDYADIPHWYAGALGCLFGLALAAYSAMRLVRALRGQEGGA